MKSMCSASGVFFRGRGVRKHPRACAAFGVFAIAAVLFCVPAVHAGELSEEAGGGAGVVLDAAQDGASGDGGNEISTGVCCNDAGEFQTDRDLCDASASRGMSAPSDAGVAGSAEAAGADAGIACMPGAGDMAGTGGSSAGFGASTQTSGDWSYAEFEWTFIGKTEAEKCYMLRKYNGNASSVTIPEKLDGHEIAGVAFPESGAFLPDSVSEVYVPSSIRVITGTAFRNSTSLEKLTFAAGSQLEYIGSNAFQGTSLERVVLPDSLRTLGSGAFFATPLKSIVFGANIDPMYCEKMSNTVAIRGEEENSTYSFHWRVLPFSTGISVTVPADAKYIKVQDGALLSKDGTVLYTLFKDCGGKVYNVPSGVKVLAQYSLGGNTTFSNVSLPSGLERMEAYCLSQTDISRLAIPDSVTDIFDDACYDCGRLEGVSVGSGVKKLGFQCFMKCPNLKNVALGSGLEHIGINAFYACTSLASIDIPSNVKRISHAAFANCSALENVTGCKGLQRIGNNAFTYAGLKGFPSFGQGFELISGSAFADSGFTPASYPGYLEYNGQDWVAKDRKLAVAGLDCYGYAYQVLDLVNEQRVDAGLSALAMDTGLLDAAMQRAAELSVCFNHTRPNSTTCFTVSESAKAENIAAYQGIPAAVMDSWMNSSGHKANILNSSYTSIGIGCFKIVNRYYWVQLFGTGISAQAQRPADASKVHTMDFDASWLDYTGVGFEILRTDSSGESNVYDSPDATGGEVRRYILGCIDGRRFTPIHNSCVSWSSSGQAGTMGGNGNFTIAKTGKETICARVKTYIEAQYEKEFYVDVWKRLAGNTAIGTMKAIVNEGWGTSDWAIVATTSGYYDALSASGLAGLLDCPILMTAQNKLSDATKALIQSKQVKNVIVVGGTSAVSNTVKVQIEMLGASVKRVAGNTAIGTANAIYEYGKTVNGGWGSDAIVATSGGYQDALSIAPFAYAKKAPIFLAGGKPGTLSDKTLSKLKAGGFTRTIIAGGEAAVAKSVESQVPGAKRLGGNTAYGTSKLIANFCISQGMSAAHMGVATGRSYYDALAGAALCGKKNSVIILADDGRLSNIDNVVGKNKDKLQESCYIFGGTSAVSQAVETQIKAASK